jgi:signal transduction histidine kinase
MELTEDNNKIKINDQIEVISQMIDDAAGITKNIISDLRPSILDDFGLLAAIEWQALQFHKLTGIEYLVNCIGDEGNLDDPHSIAIFRILQEALTNVTKHSGASRVEIEYHHSKDEVLMTISDNGRGLSDGQEGKPGAFGMIGMRERVKQLGGAIRFDMPQGGGVCLMVAFPLAAKPKQ